MINELPRHDTSRIVGAFVRAYAALSFEDRARLGLNELDTIYMEERVACLMSCIRDDVGGGTVYARENGPQGQGLAAIDEWEATFAEREDDAERRRQRERAITARNLELDARLYG